MNEAQGERLQKVLARAGVGSRRAVEEMIERGRIEVNGIRASLGQRIDPAKDLVKVDGSLVPLQEDLVHYLLNKPAGVVSTADDPEGRPTVVDLIETEARVWPVGRLDLETEGALLLTNDGELTLHLTHPRFGVSKTYVAEVQGSVTPRTARLLARGIELEDGPTAPAQARVLERAATASVVELVLKEGRNRQARRMFEAVGHPVRRLVRTSIGPLKLGRLKPGTYRKLGPAEVRALYRAAGL
ncbi:MAG: rRNA pseudouridine synthase [Actinomycetota bacterium]|nr:rRNA pseudouridine synthase [Actinomycetota bacterium]